MITSREWNLVWSEYSETNRLNPAQAYRQKLILTELKSATRVLDVGCGNGELLEKIQAKFPQAILGGLDGSTEALEQTKRKVNGARTFLADLSDHAPSGPLGWASHITCSEVLEHLDNPEAALCYSLRWLEPGGKIVLTVPAGPMTAFDVYLGHRRHFTANELKAMLLASGYERVSVRRAGFPFFNLYRLVVLARGEKVRDAAASPSPAAKSAMGIFRRLFAFNLPRGPWGWQLVATAHRPV